MHTPAHHDDWCPSTETSDSLDIGNPVRKLGSIFTYCQWPWSAWTECRCFTNPDLYSEIYPMNKTGYSPHSRVWLHVFNLSKFTSGLQTRTKSITQTFPDALHIPGYIIYPLKPKKESASTFLLSAPWFPKQRWLLKITRLRCLPFR